MTNPIMRLDGKVAFVTGAAYAAPGTDMTQQPLGATIRRLVTNRVFMGLALG